MTTLFIHIATPLGSIKKTLAKIMGRGITIGKKIMRHVIGYSVR